MASTWAAQSVYKIFLKVIYERLKSRIPHPAVRRQRNPLCLTYSYYKPDLSGFTLNKKIPRTNKRPTVRPRAVHRRGGGQRVRGILIL